MTEIGLTYTEAFYCINANTVYTEILILKLPQTPDIFNQKGNIIASACSLRLISPYLRNLTGGSKTISA